MSDNSEGANWTVIVIYLAGISFYLLFYLFNKIGWNFIFFLILIVGIIWLITFLLKKEAPNNSEQNSQRQSTPEETLYPSNQTRNNSSSANTSPQNIQWTEIGTYSSNNSQATQQNNIKFDNFIDLSDATANTEELISNLIGQKDRVTGDVFISGEKVYFCVPCQLGYHEDSWQFLDQKCEQCKSANVSTYTLTVSKVTQQPLTISKPTSSRGKVAQKHISALDLETIRRQFGNIITIQGQIRSVRVDQNYNIIYFDFAENTYQGFYAYVIRDKCNDFLIPMIYEGKNVIVSGRLTLNNRNQPRIRLNERSQMRKS
ncbi:hypothetical protein A2T98_10090 [Nodularia spumigena CENA596]|uniref:Uncharacterized protein n=1 Tax=Nodularia spumigena CENA596 TaxID=1819295 RepID=A0A161XMF4_NODSP|nr:hypothetical protein [Nodularia spumigena]KZL49924.1 hypothetical protein A2T98_10090 [Nodularia spumigena CENA596]